MVPPHTPGRVADMEPVIVRLANRQIDVLPGKTRIELVEDFVDIPEVLAKYDY